MAEVNNLRQKVTIMEKELSSNAVRLNASENAKKSSEEKLKKYEEQIKKLESTKVWYLAIILCMHSLIFFTFLSGFCKYVCQKQICKSFS